MAQAAIERLHLLDTGKELSIIKFSRSITDSDESLSGLKRASDASAASADDEVTPASLAADLVHYKELFSKLRFSYIEQVTKEKFLRAITSETPLFIEPYENAQLEEQLAAEKIDLKDQKEEVTALKEKLENTGRELANRYENIQLQTTSLEDIPSRITELESEIEVLRAAYPSPSKADNPDLNLPLQATLSLLAERQVEISDVDAQIQQIRLLLPQKSRELERLESELQPLVHQKKVAVVRAKEARMRKEQGGVDELELKGRWYRAADVVMREMLDLSGQL